VSSTSPPPSAPPRGDARTERPSGRGGPTDPAHDFELRRGILHTTITRPMAGLLVVTFLLVIWTVPVAQAVLEVTRGDESVLPDLFRHAPTKDSIKQFEEDLEKASYVREAVRPEVQYALTRYGGFGNSKAVIGRQGWLFYQPGLVAVGGPPFLDEAILASRRKLALDEDARAPAEPDPRPAILDFAHYLSTRGIRLVLFPVPDKAALQPAELSARLERSGAPAVNPDYPRLVVELERAGVAVFDPTPARLDVDAEPRFLRQDTHWTPEWMEETAGALARFLASRGLLGPSVAPRSFPTVSKTVSRVGDIVDMLRLPEWQSLYLPQTVTVHEVHTADGALFAPTPGPTSEVLVLGDSFFNIYTLGQMGWGEAAGFGPQLARALGRDIDVIAQNDAGAHATRQLLWNALAEDTQPGDDPGGADANAHVKAKDRLQGKKLVIWELASRELAVGNWKPLIWPPAGEPRAGMGNR